MPRPQKRYRIRVSGQQRDNIDPDLLMQALLIMVEERIRAASSESTSEDGGPGDAGRTRETSA